MSIGTIIQVILAIPKIIGMILSLIKQIELMKEKSKQSDLNSAIAASKAATSKEEMKKANEETTRNLP
jgi:hypothetical protein